MRKILKNVCLITKKEACFLCKTTAVFFTNALTVLEKKLYNGRYSFITMRGAVSLCHTIFF